LIIGVAIMALFGSLFTFVIPRYIEKNDASGEGQADGMRMARWMRVLGSVILFVCVIQLVIFFFFNERGT
jgi:O-antigen/teichoic acid export membrane protein